MADVVAHRIVMRTVLWDGRMLTTIRGQSMPRSMRDGRSSPAVSRRRAGPASHGHDRSGIDQRRRAPLTEKDAVPSVRIPSAPPLSSCKLPNSLGKRRNSFWFQKGLAEATVLLRLRSGRKLVSERLPSHSDRTSPKSVRSKNVVESQQFKNPA